ncbi:hypothetical protein [Pseudoclavibacter sp. VKM Ac-2888]|uniref:hypothetical protein n=1 Tax=Pseudoclavibacter sp. VKM Ac-2888 TaxID=2783830 RepID=UPI00188AC4C0|nr:hypothetical protein [Pseudoclavibacter sp. VKM Ac-2888]MBF4549320.1 hypothetical protein [Pseudoclavibacter sp. VKM Ac-2888]
MFVRIRNRELLHMTSVRKPFVPNGPSRADLHRSPNHASVSLGESRPPHTRTRRGSARWQPRTTVALAACLALPAAALGVALTLQLAVTSPAKTRTITSKRESEGVEDVTLRTVTTAECGDFRVGNAILLGHRSAGRVYRTLETGQAHVLETRGPDLWFLGLHRNIIAAQPTAS